MECKSLKPVIEYLEHLFSEFNLYFYNNELQKPLITVSPDTTRVGTFGWCSAHKMWKENNDFDCLDDNSMLEFDNTGHFEINLCSEYINQSVEAIAETLLHEMVHLYNSQIGVKDTSRYGTYHNKKFRDEAERHGLIVKRDSTYGYALTSLSEEALKFIASLKTENIQLHRIRTKNINKNSTRKLVCPKCGNIVRVTKPNMNILCGDCLVRFEEKRK